MNISAPFRAAGGGVTTGIFPAASGEVMQHRRKNTYSITNENYGLSETPSRVYECDGEEMVKRVMATMKRLSSTEVRLTLGTSLAVAAIT